MAHVTINSGPIDAGDTLREVPHNKWFELMQVRRDFLGVHLPLDCRRLLEFVEDAEHMHGPLGFASVNDFIKRGLELDPKQVEWALTGLRRMRPDEPIPYAKAIALGQPGQYGKGRPVRVGNTKSISDDGMTAPYVLARLDRDGHAALAAQVRAGTLSAHAAAKSIGYRKKPTSLDQLRKFWLKATEEERKIFRTEIEV